MKFVVDPGEFTDLKPLGGKARALALLKDSDLRIPDWFAVLPSACEISLSQERPHILRGHCSPADVERVFEGLYPDQNVIKELEEALAGLCPQGQLVAVRSSAVEEDGDTHSFAGQLESFL